MDALTFWIAGATAIAASLLVVTRRNPVYGAIFLVLFFTMVSLQFLVLGAPFLAVIQVLIYAGAVMVLFLFVLMLLNLTPQELEEHVSRWRRAGAALGSLALFALLATAVARSPAVQEAAPLTAPPRDPALARAGETAPLARALFSDHVLPFELTSILILVAIAGAVYLTRAAKRGEARPEEERPPAAAPAGVAASGRQAAPSPGEAMAGKSAEEGR